MKTLLRNKQTFYYALYVSKTALTDEYGNYTSEYEITYTDPVKASANISAAQGDAEVRQFGSDVSYDKTIVMGSDAPDMDEHSVLWVDTAPSLAEDGSLELDDEGSAVTPYDYIVTKVAKSLNSVSFAISKVDVS